MIPIPWKSEWGSFICDDADIREISLLMLRSGQEVLLARQNGVENHSHHERHRDAVGSENGLEQRREVGENVATWVKPMPMVRLNAAMVMLRCV